MSFDKYIQSCYHQHNLPESFLLCLCGHFHPPTLVVGKHSSDFGPYRFAFSRILHKCVHTICSLFSLASFSWYNTFEIYSCCRAHQWFIPLYCWVEFFCMCISPQCVYTFTSRWTFRLLLLLSSMNKATMNIWVLGVGLLGGIAWYI